MGKRAFDLAASGLGLLVLAPVFAFIALAIRFDSPGPVFYRQERVGRGGKPFLIFKFRTMQVDADRVGGPLTVGGDPRITRAGRFLRKGKLDELPQLLNVVRGEMSLVGPRPEVPKYVALYTPEQREVLEVRPGITDPASIEFRDENELLEGSSDPEALYVSEILPRKLGLNLEYARGAGFFYDIRVILATLRCLLSPGSRVGVTGNPRSGGRRAGN